VCALFLHALAADAQVPRPSPPLRLAGEGRNDATLPLAEAFAALEQAPKVSVLSPFVLHRVGEAVTDAAGQMGAEIEEIAPAAACRAQEVRSHTAEYRPLKVRYPNLSALAIGNREKDGSSFAQANSAIALERSDVDAGRLLDQAARSSGRLCAECGIPIKSIGQHKT
jgi:hypothetical protein